jgi:hypothetical protein
MEDKPLLSHNRAYVANIHVHEDISIGNESGILSTKLITGAQDSKEAQLI